MYWVVQPVAPPLTCLNFCTYLPDETCEQNQGRGCGCWQGEAGVLCVFCLWGSASFLRWFCGLTWYPSANAWDPIFMKPEHHYHFQTKRRDCPVSYKAQWTSWPTSCVFCSWLHSENHGFSVFHLARPGVSGAGVDVVRSFFHMPQSSLAALEAMLGAVLRQWLSHSGLNSGWGNYRRRYF